MTVGAVGPSVAAANGEGHFISEADHTNIFGVEKAPAHVLNFIRHGISGEIGCETVAFTGTMSSATVTEILLTPTYKNCITTGTTTSVPIDANGCTLRLTVAKPTNDATEQTSHLECPPGQAMKATHPNCTITTHPQTINTGITYTHTINPTTLKNEITVDFKIQLSSTTHGLCQFVTPTNGTCTINGSITMRGQNLSGQAVSITAT